MLRTLTLMLLAVLMAPSVADAQATQNAAHASEKVKQPIEVSESGWVHQVVSECLTCAPPEVRFCLGDEPRPKSCSRYFVYQNKAKEEVGSNYTALLTALGSDKPVSVDIPNPSNSLAQGGAEVAQPQPGRVPPSVAPGATFQNPYSANRISVLAFSQPPPSTGNLRPYDYVTAVQVIDGYLYIGVRGAFTHKLSCNATFVKSASPIGDPATQAMESIALASFLGMKKVAIWVIDCEKKEDYSIMTAVNVNQ